MSVYKKLANQIQTSPVAPFTLLSWSSLVGCSSYYCYLYGVIYAQQDDFMCYVKWAVWSWMIWFILIPVIFSKIEKSHRQQHQSTFLQQLNQVAKLGLMLCSIALLVQLIGTWMMGEDVIKDIYYYFPTNIKIFIITSLMAFVVIHKKQEQSINKQKAVNNEVLLECLNHQNQKITININDIDRLSTYGNYVQIHHSEGMYLKRITMKAMEEKLMSSLFIRIHRSHMINHNIIDSICYKNGKQILLTTSHDELPIGRSYKNNLIDEVGDYSVLPHH